MIVPIVTSSLVLGIPYALLLIKEWGLKSDHSSNLHLRNALGHHELHVGCRDHVVRCESGRAVSSQSRRLTSRLLTLFTLKVASFIAHTNDGETN
jgi:hypothetical protein